MHFEYTVTCLHPHLNNIPAIDSFRYYTQRQLHQEYVHTHCSHTFYYRDQPVYCIYTQEGVRKPIYSCSYRKHPQFQTVDSLGQDENIKLDPYRFSTFGPFG